MNDSAVVREKVLHQPRIGKRPPLWLLPRLTEILIALFIVWMGASWFRPISPVTTIATGNMGEIVAAGDKSPDVGKIISASPFGQYLNQPTTIQPAGPSHPVTISKLNLKLMGTVVAEERSAAFVVPPKGSGQDVFFVGDTILPGVRLTGVESTHIVIDDHGKSEKVILEDSKGGLSTPVSSPSGSVQPTSNTSREVHVATPPTNRILPPKETLPARAIKDIRVKSPTSIASPYVGRSTNRSNQR